MLKARQPHQTHYFGGSDEQAYDYALVIGGDIFALIRGEKSAHRVTVTYGTIMNISVARVSDEDIEKRFSKCVLYGSLSHTVLYDCGVISSKQSKQFSKFVVVNGATSTAIEYSVLVDGTVLVNTDDVLTINEYWERMTNILRKVPPRFSGVVSEALGLFFDIAAPPIFD